MTMVAVLPSRQATCQNGAKKMSSTLRHASPGTALLTALTLSTGLSAAEEAVRLVEKFPVGYQYHVRTRVDLNGSLLLPAEKDKTAPKPLEIRGDSAIEYDEKVLALTKDGQVQKTMRILERMDFHRTTGDREQKSSLRREVRRLVLLRRKNVEVPFSPDGPLTWGEIDLVRTDVFTPALGGMLPERAVKPGDRWEANLIAVQELTDLEQIDTGTLQCKLESIFRREKQRLARVAFNGAITGTGEDGRNRQRLEGYFEFDLDGGYLSYVLLKGRHTLLEGTKEVGSIEGRFVMSRKANTRSPDLTDEKLKGVAQEPNADNTLLLYDDPDLGVRFLYPRRWRVAVTGGRQIAVDASDGSAGLLITIETPARMPTGTQFLTESRDWLVSQKAKVLKTEAVRQIRTAPSLEHFSLEAEMNGQKFVMDYHVLRQNEGGATFAARLPPSDFVELQQEVGRLAQSLTISRRIEEPKKK
jgi:hypothetical protein